MDISCQGSARSADLHALDSNKTIHFIIGRVKKILFHRPLEGVPTLFITVFYIDITLPGIYFTYYW